MYLQTTKRTMVVVGAITLAMLCAVSAAQTPSNPDGSSGSSLPSSDDSVLFRDDTVELHFADTPLATVLRMLSVQGRRNIVASSAVSGSVTADLYDTSFEAALKAILLANGCDYEERDGFIYVYTMKEMAEMIARQKPMDSQVFHLNYIRSTDAFAVLEPLISESGKIAKSTESERGLESNLSSSGADLLSGRDFVIVHDYPERLEKIAIVVKQIDVRPQQVLVEAMIMRARLTDDNALGIDFTLLGGVDLELMSAVSRGVEDVTLGVLPQDRLERFNSNATTRFTQNVPEGGFTLGILKDHVGVFVRALEEITDTSVIANPKVLALNKQIGNVIVGRRDGYITTTVTETQAVQKVEFLETGTQLTFRPFIKSDGYVTMEIHPEDSVGGLTAAQLPFEQTTEVTTNVRVRDGHTILIGGLFREVSSESRAQVPFLGDLPKIGDLFRSRADAIDREEVIILLTVHVIKDDEVYARESHHQRVGIEKTRVSLQQNMMWHGRDRVAQAYYRKALEQFEAGDHDRAAWNLRVALSNAPRNLPAIQLYERIAEGSDWEDDGTVAREFIFELMERDPARPVENESND